MDEFTAVKGVQETRSQSESPACQSGVFQVFTSRQHFAVLFFHSTVIIDTKMTAPLTRMALSTLGTDPELTP